jgi:hypothetical protein
MRIATFVAVTLFAFAASACTHVAPYERGRLAHHTMVDEYDGPASGHVHAVHEGATGGGGIGESGCGCN